MSVTAATGVSEYKVLEFGLGKGCLERIFLFSPFNKESVVFYRPLEREFSWNNMKVKRRDYCMACMCLYSTHFFSFFGLSSSTEGAGLMGQMDLLAENG